MKHIMLLCVVASGVLLTQCTKEPLDHLNAEESRIYVTNYDTSAVFPAYKTYKIVDSVANIKDNQLQSKTLDNTDAQIISTVQHALSDRGFVPATGTGNADLGVTVSTITNTSTQLVDYSNYGGYYGGYWDPFYWGYSDYAYNFPTYYGIYQTGETALSIDIIDLKNAPQNGNQLDVVWSGLIRGTGIFSSATIDNQIAALFSQSPYLSSNQ